MKSSITKSLLLLASLTTTSAFADDCDYVGRHYKTDVTITGATTFPASRQGDIAISPSLQLKFTNVGVYEITDPARPGDFIHARQVNVNVKGAILRGFMPVPLAPGASTLVNFSLPTPLVGTCETIVASMVNDGSIPQYGCEVFSNDSITFMAKFQSRFCDIFRPIPHPVPSKEEGQNEESSASESNANELHTDE